MSRDLFDPTPRCFLPTDRPELQAPAVKRWPPIQILARGRTV